MVTLRRVILAAVVPGLAVVVACGRGEGTKLTLRLGLIRISRPR